MLVASNSLLVCSFSELAAWRGASSAAAAAAKAHGDDWKREEIDMMSLLKCTNGTTKEEDVVVWCGEMVMVVGGFEV